MATGGRAVAQLLPPCHQLQPGSPEPIAWTTDVPGADNNRCEKTHDKKEQMVFMMRLSEKKTLRRNSLGKLGGGEGGISDETTEQQDERLWKERG